MKLILREYVASLKEREELDAILPDILSEMGFHVYSRPGRGTTQYGVDIAAVGPDEDGETKLFLLSVKRGDLTRQEWSTGVQALRPSLEEILDVYIRSHIPPSYSGLKIVICLCFGGRVRENVRAQVTGFTTEKQTDQISFREWDGDKIAGLLLTGILREEVLPKPLRSTFQKAVALVDEPDVSFDHFAGLLRNLHAATQEPGARVRSARQIYLCLWILFVWARDADNIEAAYRASERALLTLWDLLRSTNSEIDSEEERSLATVLQQMIAVHLTIGDAFLDTRILPHVSVRHGISMAVGSNSSVDINLKLFEVLGRLALSGLWVHWLRSQPGLPSEVSELAATKIQKLCEAGLALIDSNPALNLPIADHQAADIACFILLCLAGDVGADKLNVWLGGMSDRLIYATKLHRRYPTSFSDYRDLVEHPRSLTAEYREEATAGSTLIPLLAAWLAKVQDTERLARLADLVGAELSHCTLQLWLPDDQSDAHLYTNSDTHGRALCDLRITPDGRDLSAVLSQALKDHGDIVLSAHARGHWPLVVLACRHWGLPIPLQYWFPPLALKETPE